MANKFFDYSANNIFNNGEDSFRTYTYRDIGTNNIVAYYDDTTDKMKIIDVDTSNYDGNSIKTSLKNLFMIRPGEHLLEPDYGNELYKYLYQPMMKFTSDKIVRTIKDMVYKWEPRIVLEQTPIEADQDDSTYYIQLKYYIPMLQEKDSMTLAINKNGSIVS